MEIRKREVNDFTFGRQIGEGSYSTVVLGTEKSTNKVFAIKILEKSHILKHDKSKYVLTEKDLLNKLNHPSIVKLWYTFQDSYRLYFALSFAPYGDLLGLVQQQRAQSKGLPINSCRLFGAEILLAIEYLHKNDIIHRDLKPENLLVNEQFHLELTDFGTACDLSAKPQAKTEANDTDSGSSRRRSFVGTAEYCSPELLSEKGASFESDLWAYGCILYQIIHGKPPFRGFTEYMTFQRILKLDYGFVSTFPEDAVNLIKQILMLDPAKRLGAQRQYGEIKKHAFFDPLNGNWDLYKDELPVDDEIKRLARQQFNYQEENPERAFLMFAS